MRGDLRSGGPSAVVAGGGGILPPGAVLLNERPWTTIATQEIPPTGNPEGWSFTEGDAFIAGNYSLQNDGAAPQSPPSVGQAFFPAGFTGAGNSPIGGTVKIGSIFPAATYKGLYHRFWFYLSAAFEGHSTGINKIFHYWWGQTGPESGNNKIFCLARGAGTVNPLRISFTTQSVPGGGANFDQNVGPANADILTRGVWNDVELYMRTSDPAVANGILRARLNGVDVINFTNVQVAAAGEANLAASLVQWSPTWGGFQVAPVTADMWMRVDHSWIYGVT